ncbi:CocE/NonD family hydrolase [Actinocrispum sp. NPDC049592]|uniref:CocE/NonD family hydrolase n=1 Tax=Actinocrispum sp. NPDC049592 TaxID=3154835 RepID=UPI0034308D70
MVDLGLEVPMRDGVVLRGVRYSPAALPAPTILMLTPYGADRRHEDGKFFAARGFHFVCVDCRGRGDSGGEFDPFAGDGRDGHDIVQWIAAQPWSSGDVVMYGGSYCGFVQWAIAATQPPALRAIAPAASVYPGVDFPNPGTIFEAYVVQWLTLVNGHRMNDVLFKDGQMWRSIALDLVAQGRPFRDLDIAAVGCRLPVFQEWLDHPSYDSYWARLVPSAEQFAGITMPVLTVTGQYDDDQQGALRYYDQHIVTPGARHDLVIGPWDHSGTRTGERSFGGLTFPESCEVDLRALHADWYDWALGRGERPAFLTDRVVYFHEDTWVPSAGIPSGPQALTLYPSGKLLARNASEETQVVELAIDPRKDENRDIQPEETRFVSAIGSLSGLVHTSSPVGEVLDLAGRPWASLTLSSELPDFDVVTEIYLLRGEQAIWLGEAPLRARHRDSITTASPWPSTVEITVELSFPFVSLRTTVDDRFAVVVRPAHHRYQVNQQAGGDISRETSADAVAGVVRLVQHRSSVSLPLSL